MLNQQPTTTREVRPNREIDKRPGSEGWKPYTKIPDDNRILCKVRNLMYPGEQIEGCIGGVTFSMIDDAEVMLHKSVIEVLQNAVIEGTEYVPDNPSQEQLVRGASQPKYMVQIIGLAQALAVQEATRDRLRTNREAQESAAESMEEAGAVDQAEVDGSKEDGSADGANDSLGFLADEVEETKKAAETAKEQTDSKK